MNRDDLIRLAREAGWDYANDSSGFDPLWKFGELVAAAEREACAKLCDAECNPAPNEGHVSSYQAGCYITAEYLAADIRRRGQG